MSIIHKKGAVELSSAGTRERYTYEYRPLGRVLSTAEWLANHGKIDTYPDARVQTGKQITVSESHPKSRDGSYREGGPFFTSRVAEFDKPGYIDNAFIQNLARVYTGPVGCRLPTEAERKELGDKNIAGEFGSTNESSLTVDGTNAISYCNPINPASQLGTTLSESYLEGLPTLPGIQLWRDKTNFLKGIGSEYLNYQFGWAPLKDEVSSVVGAARRHRDLLQQYHRGEGSDTHRTFEFPIQRTVARTSYKSSESHWRYFPYERSGGDRQVSLVRETRKWFEGCFTYGLPSSTDSWRKALGFGSDADQLFGISLSPDVLWELTPWSWAVDWFSNAGEVINNVTNFGLAGLVLRYGYMMEESIERVTAESKGVVFPTLIINKDETSWTKSSKGSGICSSGYETVTKRRLPASPFGFGIGWEGLSPTQLAITAALGITRLL